MPSGGGAHDTLVISLEAWDDVWRRNQYLVDGLLRRDGDMRVLFVEPPRDRLHDLLHGRASTPARGARAHPGYDGRLVLFEPAKLLPRALGPAADRSWRRQVARAMHDLGMQRPLVWVNDSQGALILRSESLPALYDVTDDWLAAPRPARELARLARNERLLLERAAEVIVCSPDLARSRGKSRPVRLIPNAVDVARYRLPAPRPSDLPARAALYVGTLHEDRLDVELTARAARELGSAGVIALVGPDSLSPASRDVLQEAGVSLLGSRPHSAVPAYLQHADVLVVPHVVDRFTDSLDPIKLYEYRAVGRPIVSTAVAGFRESTAPGLVIATAERFPAAVSAALRERKPTIVDQGVPDWSERVDDMHAVLESIRAADARQRTPRSS